MSTVIVKKFILKINLNKTDRKPKSSNNEKKSIENVVNILPFPKCTRPNFTNWFYQI